MTTCVPGGSVRADAHDGVVDRVVEARGNRPDGRSPEQPSTSTGTRPHRNTRPRRAGQHAAISSVAGYLTVISTRRLRGSGVSSGVLTSRSASPCEVTSMVDASRPACTRRCANGSRALQAERRVRLSASPIVSVWPTTSDFGNGALLARRSESRARARGTRRSARRTRSGSTA